jgi:hypothetical protein
MPLFQVQNERELSIIAEYSKRTWKNPGAALWIDGRKGNVCGWIHSLNGNSTERTQQSGREFFPLSEKYYFLRLANGIQP